MKNSFWLPFAAACTLFCTAYAAPSPDDAVKFQKAVSNVDMNGEMLYYQNSAGVQKLLTRFIPQLLKYALKDNPLAPVIQRNWDSLCQIINPSAFEAVALSSKEIDDDLYLFKSYILLDRQKKSIFIEPVAVNTQLDWQNFPEDTVAAVKARINLKHLWNTIVDQIKNSPDQTSQALLLQIEMLKQTGMDINAIISGLEGDLEIIIAGTSVNDLAVKFVLPDQTGVFSAIIAPLIQGLDIPLNNFQLKSAIVPGKLIFYTSERLLSPPQNNLGNSAVFKKFTAQLPEQGNLAVAFHLSKQMIDQLKYTTAAQNPVFAEFCNNLEPLALLGVQSAEKDGDKAVIVSNFSIPQAKQLCSLVAPVAATVLPALNSSREKSRIVQCMNNMKQFALACHLFANDTDDTLPLSINQLIEKKLLNTEISANIIFLAPGVKISEIPIPSQYPLAICNRFNHKSDKVCVAFIDGHVEVMDVPKSSDEKDIIGILSKKFNHTQTVHDTLMKAISEENK